MGAVRFGGPRSASLAAIAVIARGTNSFQCLFSGMENTLGFFLRSCVVVPQPRPAIRTWLRTWVVNGAIALAAFAPLFVVLWAINGTPSADTLEIDSRCRTRSDDGVEMAGSVDVTVAGLKWASCWWIEPPVRWLSRIARLKSCGTGMRRRSCGRVHDWRRQLPSASNRPRHDPRCDPARRAFGGRARTSRPLLAAFRHTTGCTVPRDSWSLLESEFAGGEDRHPEQQ